MRDLLVEKEDRISSVGGDSTRPFSKCENIHDAESP